MIKIKDLIVITGPTASGKTSLSIELAKIIGAEIVNADSMQIYKYMDIGTAKPTPEEMGNVTHHLIDIVEPSEAFSVARYCELAHKVIDDIHKRGKKAIMVGGTGLYIDSVVNNIQFTQMEPDAQYREELNKIADERGNEYIYDMLRAVDVSSAEKIAVADRKRIIRALEVYKTTGMTITQHNELSRSVPSKYNTAIFAINTDRERLYDKINKRVDIMLEAGLVDEVKRMLDMGVDSFCTSMQAIGYKEIVEYLHGNMTLDEAVEAIKQGSRRYAKRQLTWFRRNSDIIWINNDVDEILNILQCQVGE